VHHVKVTTVIVSRRRPRDRKAQIAVVAAELFGERGYPAVGIDDIAAVVGISGPAIYRHFPTKYAILVHAGRELTGQLLDATADLSTLDEVVDVLADFAVRRRTVGGLYQWQGRYLVGEDKVWLRSAFTTMLHRLSEPIARLRPELSRSDAELLAKAVFSVLASLSTHRAPAPPEPAHQVLHHAAWTLARAEPVGIDLAPVVSQPPVPATGAPRREALLAAALTLFHERGYHAVSMDDIGRAAGTTASSIYRYFPAKVELLAAVYHRAAERITANAADAIATAASPEDALRRLVASYVDLVFGHSDLVSVYSTALGALPAEDRHELRKAQRLHVEEWVRLVVARQPDLDVVAARLRVHAALNVVFDLCQARADRGIVTALALLVLA
jgi:AcrR family transcriptional regulator